MVSPLHLLMTDQDKSEQLQALYALTNEIVHLMPWVVLAEFTLGGVGMVLIQMEPVAEFTRKHRKLAIGILAATMVVGSFPLAIGIRYLHHTYGLWPFYF